MLPTAKKLPKIEKMREKSGKKGEKIEEKEEKSGRKCKNQEGSFTLLLLKNRAGYATGLTASIELVGRCTKALWTKEEEREESAWVLDLEERTSN